MDDQVRNCAVHLEDTELLAKLSTIEMKALDAKYHAKYLVSLYNWARKAKKEDHTDEASIASETAFAELVMQQIDSTGF